MMTRHSISVYLKQPNLWQYFDKYAIITDIKNSERLTPDMPCLKKLQLSS